MKLRSLFICAATLATMLAATAARAEDDMVIDAMQVDPAQESLSDDYSTDDNSKCGKGCCDCCCDQGGFVFLAEATFFKFYDSNGVEDFGGNDAEFDFEVNPRLTLGYVACDGLGARVRYWEFDEDTVSVANNNVAVNTYNIDLEAFQAVELNSCTSVEFMGGVRYNEFDMDRSGARRDSFNGFGGMLGLEGRRDFGCGLSAYGRYRHVIFADDFFMSGTSQDENDGIKGQQEIALGVAYTNCNWTLTAGYEWQVWQNYTRGTASNIDEETSDVGFSGFVVGAGYAY